MTPYFDKPEMMALLAAAARDWVGTPFHPHARIKGVGVDCVNLAAAIYEACGVLPAGTRFPHYTMDGGSHDSASRVLEFVRSLAQFEPVTVPETSAPACKSCGEAPVSVSGALLAALAPGDLLGFKVGRVVHHTGVYLGNNEFIHAHRPSAAHCSRVDDTTWFTRLTTVHRPMRGGEV